MRLLAQFLAIALSACLAPAAVAHHSFAAGYDGEQQVTLTGKVAKVDWANPHVHFSVDVISDDGKVTQWRFEGYPTNMLVRQGWKRDDTMKIGDTVTVFGWRARTEPSLAAARWVTWADGHKLAAGPPAGTGGR